ncbi:MAG: tetratricopeptide repeat protein [Myxococcota bacterium]
MLRLFASIGALLYAFGCGGAAIQPGSLDHVHPSAGVPTQITQANFPGSVRLYHTLGADHPDRIGLRDQLIGQLALQSQALMDEGDYDAVVEHFAAMTELLLPIDFSRSDLPENLEPVARFVADHGSPRGEEAAVMSALLVLSRLRPDEETHQNEYRLIQRWGRNARRSLGGDIEAVSKLIEVWTEHADLTPSPEVLETAASLHSERRAAILAALESGADGFPLRLRSISPHLIRRAPLDVASIFLEHGIVEVAIERVEAMGDISGTEVRLLRTLRDARGGGRSGDDAILELAELFLTARPQVSFGLCRSGMQRNSDSPVFPTCLARVATVQERLADATAWYARAIELGPDQRALYDEALSQLDEFLEAGLFRGNPNEARLLARNADAILEARLERWPESAPPVARERLQFLVGMLEMNAGNTSAARSHLQASLEAGENSGALLQLGLLQERTGNVNEAARLYRRALDLTPHDQREGSARRAELLEHLGDAFLATGSRRQAIRMYREALSIWGDILPTIRGPASAMVYVRQGVLFDRIDAPEQAEQAFRRAMYAAPTWREPYAGILSHLVASRPNIDLANDVFRRAQRQLSLAPEWKVYFALWVKAVAGRDGAQVDPEVDRLLTDMAESSAWWGRLALFGAGELAYDTLLEEASGLGEQTEAHFYEGARLLAQGDLAGADALFRRVLETNMVSFYEFLMAKKLITKTGDSP